MQRHGANRVFAKKLAPNDNSKNQVYLGGDFSALNIIPHGDIYIDDQARAGSKQDRPKAPVRFSWVDDDGRYLAPGANLILYPDYPEVRLSGFLQGCRRAPSDLMNKRLDGRVMFFGVTHDGEVLGYVVADGDPVGEEVKTGRFEELGVFLELPRSRGMSPRSILLGELRRIFEMGWIPSQKLDRDRTKRPYAARNGGGYTLEAELGITPNGYSEPDFMGWEVKQFGVRNFERYAPMSPVTLMTPEPTGGLYKSDGLSAFMRCYGYSDRAGRVGRTNFGGVYRCGGDHHDLTGLRMTIDGFDAETGKIADLEAGISLLDRNGEVAATWSFKGLMEHWNRKHAQAAYVPSLCQASPLTYRYASLVGLCEGTDFVLFLKGFVAGTIYYDPAIKLVETEQGFDTKRRSQFRVRHSDLAGLYRSNEIVDVATS
jgi:hypothetical protein